MSSIKNRTILQGDVLEKLKEIPSESIDCIITSPPYWGLRDYGVEGQWGLESDFKEYLSKMRSLMRELKRVLKQTGSCWINLGDSYSGSGKGFGGDPEASKEVYHFEKKPLLNYTIQEKSLMMIPWEFAINCRDDGWTIRNVIPWYKENSMPSSVKDRFANKWEPIFFMTKNRKYYFSLNAVRVKPKTETKPFNIRVRDAKKGLGQLKLGDDPRAWKMSKEEDKEYNEKGEKIRKGCRTNNETSPLQHPNRNFMPIKNKQDSVLGVDSEGYNPLGKNPGDVFFINPKPFPEAHFATFPEELPLKILKCACPEQVCIKCGMPRFPIIKPTKDYEEYMKLKKWHGDGAGLEQGCGVGKSDGSITSSYEVIDHTKCNCNSGFEVGIVLDPFFGAGTVGVAAEKLGINWIGIELKVEYIEIARKRLEPFLNQRLVI